MCAVCHPGGGGVELDRTGNRYDQFAADPKNGISPGGINGFDGDYFKAKWAESGVLEADCLICHLKDYNNKQRKQQIKALNFRWAATVGAGFGKVEGSVSKGEQPKLTYDASIFQEDGKVLLPVVKEVSNENCLFCHRETDWKKRGSSYSARTDVHIRAGLRCVDCHVTGRKAEDFRIAGREEHQIGKGDDPGTLVRDDLDNTMRRCEDCHLKGILNAPVIRHRGLPPAHLEKIACQTCHIPWRQVKAALVQDASVYNISPRIAPPPKRIWSFYDPEMKPWNYYGDALGYPEGLQPLFEFRPVLGWYKERLYPLNRVYTLWVGIKADGERGINYPYMKDVFTMWNKHVSAPDDVFPVLKQIKDDNLDGFLEINRTEEVTAILASVASMLTAKGASLEGKEVVFVDGDRYTADGTNWKSIAKKRYEYSPYGSVFKLSHDITPARNALGAKGCSDCHSLESEFFFRDIMVRPFDGQGKPVVQKSASFMGYSPTALSLMDFENKVLRRSVFWFIFAVFVLLLFHYVTFGPKRLVPQDSMAAQYRTGERIIHYLSLIVFAMLAATGLITYSALPLSSSTIGQLHTIHHYSGYLFIVSFLLIISVWSRDMAFGRLDWKWFKDLGGYFGYRDDLRLGRFNAGQKLLFWMLLVVFIMLAVTGLILIWAKGTNLRFIAHGTHSIAALLAIIFVMGHMYLGALANPGASRNIFEGRIGALREKDEPVRKARGPKH